jgi:peptidoglycan/LPS O-acetylase OafA/YrhL
LRREIKSHTGLRGFAALLVVAYHLQFGDGYKLPVETATSLFKRCYLMVDLFFILSGFILCYVMNADRGITFAQARTFLRDRFARIYPLHVFALGFLTAFTLATAGLLTATGHGRQDLGSFGDWLSQLLLLNAWRPAQTEWNVPSWSISAEAFAYVLFPLLVTVWAARPRLTQAAVVAGSFLFYVLAGRSLDITVGLAPLRCLAGFGLGMVLFYHRALIERIPGRNLLQLATVAWILTALAIPVRDAVIVPAFAALVFLTWTDEGIVARWLSAGPLQWLGKLSYSVYLMHVPVNVAVWFVWGRLEPRLHLDAAVSRAMFLCLMFITVLAVASFTYAFVEKPWRERLRHRRTASPVAAVAAP